jgi:hypothetical protein
MPDIDKFKMWLRDELRTSSRFENLGGRGQGFHAQFKDNDSSLSIRVVSTERNYIVPWNHIEQCYLKCGLLDGERKFQAGS